MNACHIIFICLQKSVAIAESVHAKDKDFWAKNDPLFKLKVDNGLILKLLFKIAL